MAYDLEEQEQLANFKDFWNKYGNLISWILIIALGSYAAWAFYRNHQVKQGGEASAMFENLQKQVAANDKAKVTKLTADLQSQYSGTIYAPMSALVAAKAAFDANDLKTAKAQLQFAADKGTDEVKAVAKLRLAGVQLDEKAFDEALKTLAGEFPAQFVAQVADRKGDILAAQNKLTEARAAYLEAYKAMDEKNPGRSLVQVKLEAIGGEVPKAAPAAADKAAAA
jgi:predicted negative regulator of RcsB-dependent stress response